MVMAGEATGATPALPGLKGSHYARGPAGRGSGAGTAYVGLRDNGAGGGTRLRRAGGLGGAEPPLPLPLPPQPFGILKD